MKFNSYVVRLNHKEDSFTGTVLFNEESISANFKKVADQIYIVFFPSQRVFAFGDKVMLKNKKKEITFLLPLLSKYNQKRLKKIAAEILSKPGFARQDILPLFLLIEKVFRIDKLLYFLGMNRQEMKDLLMEMELNQQLKIIEFSTLMVMTFECYLSYYSRFEQLLNAALNKRIKALKISEIEGALKLTSASVFFRYLLKVLALKFPFRFIQDKLLFQKFNLHEKDLELISNMERQLRKNHSVIFSLDEVMKLTGNEYKEINDVFWHLMDSEKLVQLNEKYFIFSDDLQKILNKLKKYKRNQGDLIDIQEFRELTIFNRKNLIILFEYFDSKHYTQRIGNQRKILLSV